MSDKKHNGSYQAKQAERLRVRSIVGPGAVVLEGFAGEGRIYRGCWHGLRGVCIDIVEEKASAAARERPDWACYRADTLKALAAGLGGSTPFDVVDLDAYGSPWKFAKAFLCSRRLFAPVTHLLLTDGYMSQRNLAPPEQSLYPDVSTKVKITSTPDAYLERVMVRMKEWAGDADVKMVRTTFSKRMALHTVEVRQKMEGRRHSDGDGPRQTSGIS